MKYIEKIEKKNAILLARECIYLLYLVLKKMSRGVGSGSPQPSFYIRLRFFYSRLKKTKNRTKFFGTECFISKRNSILRLCQPNMVEQEIVEEEEK